MLFFIIGGFSVTQDHSVEYSRRTLSVCETLYGSFYQKFIEVPGKTADEVRNEIINNINDPLIHIDLYIYIMKSDNGTIIKAI